MISKKLKIIFLILIFGLVVFSLSFENKLSVGVNIDNIIVLKSKRKLQVYSDGQLIKTYKISLGRKPIGDKDFEGDKKTPEGVYLINTKSLDSKYYKNLGISYPNTEDIEKAKKFGKSPGGNIKIHGIKNGFGFLGKLHRLYDWTLGCIALTNKEIDELYNAVEIGTRIKIKP